MKRFGLMIEMILGVLPITVIGGFYTLLGIVFGVVSVFVSIQQKAPGAALWWLAVLTLALGGLAGITGLWLLILVTEFGGTQTTRRLAIAGSSIGVVTALVAVALSTSNASLSWWTLYLLVSPIVVLLYRAYRLKTASGPTTAP
jgi:hypothetical protein